jgi:uncharacterized protein (TIGR02996 family)
MHPDLASLLHYARRFPDDDAARRVIADWLEENGDQDGRARADFFRLQLDLAAEPDPERRDRLADEAERLRRQHLHYWLGPFVEVPGVVGARFERGMLWLELTGGVLGYGLERLAALPEWAWVEGVVCEGWDNPLAGELAGSPTLAGLRHLVAHHADLSSGGVERLGGNPAAAGLLTLDLAYCRWARESDLDALAGSEPLAGLRRLVLVGAWVTPRHWRQLRERFGERVVLPEPAELPF